MNIAGHKLFIKLYQAFYRTVGASKILAFGLHTVPGGGSSPVFMYLIVWSEVQLDTVTERPCCSC